MENNEEVKSEEVKQESVKPKKKPNVAFTLFACIMTGVIVFLSMNLGQKASKIVDPDTGKTTKTENKEESNSNEESNETSNVTTVEEKDITSAETKEKYAKLVKALEYGNIEAKGTLVSGNLYLKDEVTVDQLTQESKFYSTLIGIENWNKIDDSDWTIDADIALKEVRSLYGDNITLYTGELSGCPNYTYNASKNQYDAKVGCGYGIIPYTNSYIYKITETDNNVYVYVAIAKINYTDVKEGEIPTTVVYYDMEETKEYSRYTNETFELTEENYSGFTKYKYTLSKNTDGSSRFVKLEKLK